MPEPFRPVLLVRGFDPMGESPANPYYGFNDGTVYPHRLGDDHIYEGMLLKFLKTDFRSRGSDAPTRYLDATNALRYTPHRAGQTPPPPDPRAVDALRRDILDGQPPTPEQMGWLTDPVRLDPQVAARFRNRPETVWVYRYYDFQVRDVLFAAQQLRRVIDMVETVTGVTGVLLVCHSMGGLVARYLIQKVYADRDEAHRHIHRWVTLGTPHRGIAFSPTERLTLGELEYFHRDRLEKDLGTPLADISPHFDPRRLLCVVGTNHRTYGVRVAAALNQAVSWLHGQDQNHSDGLVKQESATLSGAYRADVFKCHGGADSLVTSREAFELAARFFFGDVRASIRISSAEIRKRYDGYRALSGFLDGKPEFYVGFSVKPRQVDFFLHQQDKESENCFGPIDHHVLEPSDFVFDREDHTRDGLIYEGVFNYALRGHNAAGEENLVFRFDTYVGERDGYLLGHSDTVIVQAQSYFEVRLAPDAPAGEPPLRLFFHPNLKNHGGPIACAHVGGGRYTLDLPFGAIDPDFKMALEVAIEGPWSQ